LQPNETKLFCDKDAAAITRVFFRPSELSLILAATFSIGSFDLKAIKHILIIFCVVNKEQGRKEVRLTFYSNRGIHIPHLIFLY